MRMLLGCAIVLVLALVASAAPQKKTDKGNAVAIEGDKLIGKWTAPPIKGLKGGKPPVREFLKDGTCNLATTAGTKTLKLEGSYKLDGDKLTMTFGGASGVPADKQTWTIKKLTDTELVLAAGKLTERLKRVK